jgi:hypothetical protein
MALLRHAGFPLRLGPPTQRSSGRLELSAGRYEANIEFLVEGGGDSLQHRERMPIVVGVFQARDDGLRGSHLPGKFRLGQACFRAQSAKPLCDPGVKPRFLDEFLNRGIVPHHGVEYLVVRVGPEQCSGMEAVVGCARSSGRSCSQF